MSDWKPIIGLEVHAELMTESKMFSACPVVDSVEAAPNTAVDALSLGLPGTLPVINLQAIEYATMVGLALNCEIPEINQFARKSYFYPDLPKGYQISQYDRPLAVNGYVDIDLQDGTSKRIRIRRAHLEEDTGKLTHTIDGKSLVDYNRAGVPLLEIVTEPDIFSAEEAEAFARKIRAILQYLGVNHGDMSKGVLRFEANVSVLHKDDKELRTRREIKNLNSIRSMYRAIQEEVAWQIKHYGKGNTIGAATLGWDENKQEIYVRRYKERADEYRYFPEPDLPIVEMKAEYVEAIRMKLPELPDKKRQRFTEELGLSAYDARVLTMEREVANYYESLLAAGTDPKAAANWIITNLFALMNKKSVAWEDINKTSIPAANLAELIKMVANGTINNNTAVKVLAMMFESGETAAVIVEREGLSQISDPNLIRNAVTKVMNENPDMVQGYLAGKDKLINALFGKIMADMAGKADPKQVRENLTEQLETMKQA